MMTEDQFIKLVASLSTQARKLFYRLVTIALKQYDKKSDKNYYKVTKDWLIVGNNLSEKPSGKCVYCRSDIEYIGYPDDWKPSRKNICYVCDFLIALGLIPPPKMTLETKKGAKNGVQ